MQECLCLCHSLNDEDAGIWGGSRPAPLALPPPANVPRLQASQCCVMALPPTAQRTFPWPERSFPGAKQPFSSPSGSDSFFSAYIVSIIAHHASPSAHQERARYVVYLYLAIPADCAPTLTPACSVRGGHCRPGGVPQPRLHAQGRRRLQRHEDARRPLSEGGALQDAGREPRGRPGEAQQDQGRAKGPGTVRVRARITSRHPSTLSNTTWPHFRRGLDRESPNHVQYTRRQASLSQQTTGRGQARQSGKPHVRLSERPERGTTCP